MRTENPDYPNNFITAIFAELEKGKIVVSPFIEHVFKAIDSDDFKAKAKDVTKILVFPTADNFGEYVDRFKSRGNNDKYIARREKEFSSLMELFHKASNQDYEKITIQPKQYLSYSLMEYGVNLIPKNG